mmetsp:Transcript_48945/g.71488  ORF Transcript_48945/g.71488 Transcript_48945/m.71488 type:complete len:204 (-) Transcript_48945:158-769(-)
MVPPKKHRGLRRNSALQRRRQRRWQQRRRRRQRRRPVPVQPRGARRRRAPGAHPRHGGGQGELPVLLQDRRLPPRRPLLPAAPQAALQPDRAGAAHVPEPGLRHRRRGRGPQLHRPPPGPGGLRGVLRGGVRGAVEVRRGGGAEHLRQPRGPPGGQRVREVRGRGGRGLGAEGAVRAVLRRPAAHLRVLPRHRLPRGPVPAVR